MRRCVELTNRIKTVKYPKLILLRCEDSNRLSELISDILNYCSYNTCIDDFTENTDYVISCSECSNEEMSGVIADTALASASDLHDLRRNGFRRLVASYEEVSELPESEEGLITYSGDNYSADVTCRNISSSGDATVFDIVSSGILSRVRINSSVYTVYEVLVCTSVLLAAGIPLASVIGYFTR